MKNTERGFIKTLTVVVVIACVALVVLAALAKYLVPGIGGTGGFANFSSGYAPKTNSLIDFTNNTGESNYFASDASRSTPNTDGVRTSAYAGKVVLYGGNYSSTDQPFEEYVLIKNTSETPVTITGWSLANGKGARPIQNSENSYVYPSPDYAYIGQGTDYLNPSGQFQVGPIRLTPNDEAYVITGGPFSQYPFSLYTSFRENMCTGYLKNYPFDPPLNKDCPYPSDDPQIRTVTDECYDYMQSLNRCEDPERDDKKNFDAETTQCRNFMLTRLNYGSCVANNRANPSFSANRWRIFLGQKREMWADRRDSITLYDSAGKIVDQLSY